MTRVKICGITNFDDAQASVIAGTDAIGFVFAPSPRQLTPAEAATIRRLMPRSIAVFGVFVAEPAEEIAQVAQFCSLDFCQVHGEITDVHYRLLGSQLIPAISVEEMDPFEVAGSFRTAAILLDAHHPDRTNPTGLPFDWKLARLTASRLNVILAGGLNPDNVTEAIDIVQPYAVDVSGGVEVRPGKKDHDKIATFIQRIRTWDSRINAGISVSSADDLFLKH